MTEMNLCDQRTAIRSIKIDLLNLTVPSQPLSVDLDEKGFFRQKSLAISNGFHIFRCIYNIDEIIRLNSPRS